jgi:hypothetical protein
MILRPDRVPKVSNLVRLSPHCAEFPRYARWKHAFLIADRAYAEQPNGPLLEEHGISADEPIRLRQPLAAVNGASQHDRIVYRHVYRIADRPSVGRYPAFVQPTGEASRDSLRRSSTRREGN